MCKGFTPYDVNLPVKWTDAKLKCEIIALGVNLSSRAIPKSVLVQIYEQLFICHSRQSCGAQYSELQ